MWALKLFTVFLAFNIYFNDVQSKSLDFTNLDNGNALLDMFSQIISAPKTASIVTRSIPVTTFTNDEIKEVVSILIKKFPETTQYINEDMIKSKISEVSPAAKVLIKYIFDGLRGIPRQLNEKYLREAIVQALSEVSGLTQSLKEEFVNLKSSSSDMPAARGNLPAFISQETVVKLLKKLKRGTGGAARLTKELNGLQDFPRSVTDTLIHEYLGKRDDQTPSNLEEPASDEPMAEEAESDESMAEDVASDVSMAEEDASDESMAEDVAPDEPMAKEAASDEQDSEELDSDEPIAKEAASDEPDSEELYSDEPQTDELESDEPVADVPPSDDSEFDEAFGKPPQIVEADEQALDEPEFDEPVQTEKNHFYIATTKELSKIIKQFTGLQGFPQNTAQRGTIYSTLQKAARKAVMDALKALNQIIDIFKCIFNAPPNKNKNKKKNKNKYKNKISEEEEEEEEKY